MDKENNMFEELTGHATGRGQAASFQGIWHIWKCGKKAAA